LESDTTLVQKLALQKENLRQRHEDAMRAKDKAWTSRLLRMQEQHHEDQLASYRRQLKIAHDAHQLEQEQLRRQAAAQSSEGN
jgi:hypothetical protein